MRNLLNLLLLIAAAAGGFYWKERPVQPQHIGGIHPERIFPITEFRSFAFIVYGRNCAPWCDRVLRSLYAQNYDHYRVLFIDDASDDTTFETAQATILACGQDHRTLLIQNETPLGDTASLYRAVDALADREIAIPLNGTDWLADADRLNRLNAFFQNPDVWVVEGNALRYPTYAPHPASPFLAFYAALYKQISLPTLLQSPPHIPLLHLAGGRTQRLLEPCLFWNEALGTRSSPMPLKTPLKPLAAFPALALPRTGTDIVLLSDESPLRLQSTLEALLAQVTGIHSLTVLYRAADPQLYLSLARTYDQIRFAPFEEGRALGKQIAEIARTTAGETILLGSDHAVWDCAVDLAECSQLLERAHVPAFALTNGLAARGSLGNGVQILGEAPALAWTLLRKQDAEPLVKKIRRAADLKEHRTGAEVALGLSLE